MARQHRMGRAQKYFKRPRHLYALLFSNGCCYIGQSVDPKERLSQHRAISGGWAGELFQMIPLGICQGTQADAERHEFAWRYKAHCAGWRVYGKPGILIDPRRRLSLRARALCWTLRWPKEHRRRGWMVANWGWVAALVIVPLVVLLAAI